MTENDRSLRGLLDALAKEAVTFARQKAGLAKAELSQQITRVGWTLVGLLLGTTLALVGIATVVDAAVLMAIDIGVRPWLATSIVGLGVLAGGALLAWRMLVRLRAARLVPRETMESLTEDAAWFKGQMIK